VNRFEDELRSALERREPPGGFADRVMSRIAEERQSRHWLPRSWMSAAAAVLLAVVGAGSWEYARGRQERLEAERARAELMQALELTSLKLQAARTKLLEKTGGIL
jgi:hypothetical protein